MGPSLDWIISQAARRARQRAGVSLYAGAASTFLGGIVLYRVAKERRAGDGAIRSTPIKRLFGMTMPGMLGDPAGLRRAESPGAATQRA